MLFRFHVARCCLLGLIGLSSAFLSKQSTVQDDIQTESKYMLAVDSIAPDSYLPLYQNGKYHSEARGIYKVRGYGFLVEINEASFRWFSVTENFGWEHTPEEPLEMLFAVEESSGRVYVKPYPSESAYILERISALPERLEKVAETSAIDTFNLISETMSELYPFFEVRNHNWSDRVAKHRATITASSSDKELFEVLESLFKNLNDGHTSLEAEVDGESRLISTGMSSLRRALTQEFEDQNEIENFGTFFRPWWQGFMTSMKDELLAGEAKTAFDETLVWGRVTPKVGYLFIKNMFNYSDSPDDLVSGLENINRTMEKIIDEFKDCDSLIIDVTLNSGGYHTYALAFASHLADQRRYALAKYPIGCPDLLQKFDVLPFRNESGELKTFTKPVYVIVSDATVSAGEEFVLAARAYPHVQIVGTRTNGMLSDILTKPLPNGWILNMSNEIFLDHQGVCFESIGIPATLPLAVYDPEQSLDTSLPSKTIKAFAEQLPPND